MGSNRHWQTLMPRSPKRNRKSLRKLASHKRASLVLRRTKFWKSRSYGLWSLLDLPRTKILRFVVFPGPATGKMLELQFVKLVVLLWLYGRNLGTPECKACGSCWTCHEQNFGSPDRGFVVFAGPAAGEFWISTLSGLWFWLDLHGQDFGTPDWKVCGLCWACYGWNFGTPVCQAYGLCLDYGRNYLRTPDC